MKLFTSGFLALILSVLSVSGAQARMTVVFQTQDGVITTINSARQLITSDFVTYSLANEQVFEKASQLRGEKVHILFYEAADEKQCVDVRMATEPAFKIATPVK